MRTFGRLLLVLAAVTVLTGCGSLWLAWYRAKGGGYYDAAREQGKIERNGR